MGYSTTVSGLRSITSPLSSEIYQTTDYGGGIWYYDPLDTTTMDDLGLTLVTVSGGRFKRIYNGAVNVLWFGAIPSDDSLSTAQNNTVAFRAACLSMKSVWDVWKESKMGRSVFVPAGDYNLSNGFTVPKSCSISGGGIGVSRLKILAITADTSNVLPLVSLGSVINDLTMQREATVGAFVQNPAPEIDNLYLNPQNSNISVDVVDVPGFAIGKLWIQATIGIRILRSSDGIINQLVIEDSSGNGIQMSGSQNIIINSIYTFVTDIPIVINGDTQNIEIGIIQANYSKVAVLMTTDGINSGRIRIGSLICNQNAQYDTFTSVVRTRSASCDISIGHLDARNYNGYAVNSETGLGNIISIDYLKLRQIPNNPLYQLGNLAKGVVVNNSSVRIGYADIDGLSGSPFIINGSYFTELRINGALIGAFTNDNTVVNITGSNGKVYLTGIVNNSLMALYNPQNFINPVWKDITNPFPIILENNRYSIKIPFVGSANSWNATIYARTNNTTPNYKRVQRLWIAQETGYNGQIITSAYIDVVGNSNLTVDYSPNITAQIDINVVGSGSAVPVVESGYIVLSVPNNYLDIQFAVSAEQ